MDNKLLECPVCIDIFNKPRVLPCGHSICEACLINIIRNNSKSIMGPRRSSTRKSGVMVSCPECRFVFIINQISKAPLNITLKNIIEKENNFNINSRDNSNLKITYV
jgi:hypothetical protein